MKCLVSMNEIVSNIQKFKRELVTFSATILMGVLIGIPFMVLPYSVVRKDGPRESKLTVLVPQLAIL